MASAAGPVPHGSSLPMGGTSMSTHNSDHLEMSNALDSLESLDDEPAGHSASNMSAQRRAKNKHDSLAETVRQWIVHHQIGLSVDILLLLVLSHSFFPAVRTHTISFFTMSYLEPQSGRYTRGIRDFCYIFTWIVIFTGLRDSVLTYVLLPLAKSAGVQTRKARLRFAEQAWLCLYYAIFWPLGMYIWSTSPYWLDFTKLWTDFPQPLLAPVEKWYYLVQFAFWLQQIVIVNIEERRKDHWQMFSHHIVTCLLLATSYGYFQTKVGNVILCIMDIVDITLPIAKMLKYTGFQLACDIAFGIFILSWIFARHIVYLAVCWSIFFDAPKFMLPGRYSKVTGALISTDISAIKYTLSSFANNFFAPFIPSVSEVWFTEEVRYVYLSMLLFLQGLMIMWLAMILRIAWGVIRGQGADDSRSEADSEDDLEEYEQTQDELIHPSASMPMQSGNTTGEKQRLRSIEQTVGVEGLNLKRRVGSKKIKEAKTTSAGFSVAGRSAQKELLGRIGCDKPS